MDALFLCFRLTQYELCDVFLVEHYLGVFLISMWRLRISMNYGKYISEEFYKNDNLITDPGNKAMKYFYFVNSVIRLGFVRWVV